MAQLKKILITIPDSLLKEVDDFVSSDNTNRSELVREAMKLYIKERRRADIRERMKLGYLEMGDINLLISNSCLEADNLQLITYEQKIAECE